MINPEKEKKKKKEKEGTREIVGFVKAAVSNKKKPHFYM